MAGVGAKAATLVAISHYHFLQLPPLRPHCTCPDAMLTMALTRTFRPDAMLMALTVLTFLY